MIDSELYKTFYTIAQHGNITEAAKSMYVSQPAVSKAIKKLEALTGCALFIRKPRGVALTTEGQILFEYVKNAFEQLNNGEQIIQKIRHKEDGIVKIGISNTLCKYFFIPYLEAFHQKYPGIQIQVINRTSPDTLRLLEQGLIDFGVVSILESRAQFEYQALMTIQDVFVFGKNDPAFKKSIPLSALAQYPLMLLEKENTTRVFLDEYCARNNVSLQPEIEIGSMDFLIEFARIGLGIACVIKNFVKEELKQKLLYEVPVCPAIPPRQIGIVRHKNVPVSNAAGAFIGFLKDAPAA